MPVEVALNTPLAEALNAAIQPKLVEVGWISGADDDSTLCEYIILMLVNGRTEDQVAAELSGELLNLGPDDPGARDFSRWLFEQVDLLNARLSGDGGQVPVAAGHGDGQVGDLARAVGDEHQFARAHRPGRRGRVVERAARPRGEDGIHVEIIPWPSGGRKPGGSAGPETQNACDHAVPPERPAHSTRTKPSSPRGS